MPPERGPRLQGLRPLFHAASWESFRYLITGLRLGQAQAQAGIVRARLLAPSRYSWRQIHDFLRPNRWEGLAVRVRWTGSVVGQRYPQGWLTPRFGVLDGTYLENRYAQVMDEVVIHRRPHPKSGPRPRRKGQGMLRGAPRYQQTPQRFWAFLRGGRWYVKQAPWVALTPQALTPLPLPEERHTVVLTERGLTAVKLVNGWPAQLFLWGRVKSNAARHLPARAADYKGRGRRPRQGKKYRAEAVPKGAMGRTEMKIAIAGKG